MTTSRLPQSVLLRSLADLKENHKLWLHKHRNSIRYCASRGTAKIQDRDGNDSYYYSYKVKCDVCGRVGEADSHMWKSQNGYIKAQNIFQKYPSFFIFLAILVLVNTALIPANISDNQFKERLVAADKAYVYKDGQVADCNAQEKSSTTRHWVDCTVVKKVDVGTYQVKYSYPNTTENYDDSGFKALDMKAKQ